MQKRLVFVLKKGGIAVIPTDTIYGIVARADDRLAVQRLFSLRRQTARKPFIILISSLRELVKFGVVPSAREQRFLEKVWPGRVSVVFRSTGKEFAYLHRGTYTLGFRVPKSLPLRLLLKTVGPLVAPSANPEGKPPARSLKEARAYFGRQVDFYEPARTRLNHTHSTILSLVSGRPRVMRGGAVASSLLLEEWDKAAAFVSKTLNYKTPFLGSHFRG